jgi:mono/diheme cytochrome c family protein
MKFQPRKSDLVFIGLALAVILFLTWLPTPRENNPRVPGDFAHRQLTSEKQCVACHTPTGVYPLPSRHPRRQDCFRCHQAEAL